MSRDDVPEVREVRRCMALGTLRTLAFTLSKMGFPGDSDGKESACSAGSPGLIPGSGKFPGDGNGLPTPVFLPGKSHGQRSLADYSLWGREESDMAE